MHNKATIRRTSNTVVSNHTNTSWCYIYIKKAKQQIIWFNILIAIK